MNDLTILAGFTAGLGMMGWAVFQGCGQFLATARDEVGFYAFKRQVRAIWATEVYAEDIIAKTGEDCWYAAYDNGLSPREAVLGVEF